MFLLVSDVIRKTEVVIYRERKELLTCGFFCSSLFLKLKNISVIHFRGTIPLNELLGSSFSDLLTFQLFLLV